MTRVTILLAILAAPLQAQIVTPDASHYARALDSLAMVQAHREVTAADAASRALNARIALQRDRIVSARAHQDRIVELWAEYVQIRSDVRPGSHRPGTGYHCVGDGCAE